MVDGKALLRGLQQGTWPSEQFGQREHVYLCWYLLGQLSRQEAASQLINALIAYTRHLGATDKYHESVTLYYFSLISGLRELLPEGHDWQTFCSNAPQDLFSHQQVLKIGFSAQEHTSPFARKHCLPPAFLDAAIAEHFLQGVHAKRRLEA